MTKFYVDGTGKYLGGFSDGNSAIPPNSIEVSNPPENATDKYVNGVWVKDKNRAIDDLKEQLNDIERREIMPRKTREIQMQVLLYFANAQGVSPSQLYAANPAFKGMKDVDDIAITLRAQIRALEP